MPEHAIAEGRKLDGRRNGEEGRPRRSPRLQRRTRDAVLSELPERVDQSLGVELTKPQATVHAEHLARAARILSKKEPLTEQDMLRLMIELTSMRIASNGLALYMYEEVRPHLSKWGPGELLRRYPSPKLEEARELLEELVSEGKKVVVFSQWTRMLELLSFVMRPVLERHDARVVLFHGKLSSRQRARAIADFHDDPRARLFFATDAGGVGLNLQEAAHTVLHLDLPWNPAVFEQRVGRVHRMGQQASVQVVSLLTPASIEGRIGEGLVQKRALFEGLFRGDTDELRFDDEARESLVERMRRLLGLSGEGPTRPNLGLVQVDQPVDAEIRRPAAPVPAPPPRPTPEAGGGAAIQLDLGSLLGAVLGGAAEPRRLPSVPVSVQRRGDRVAVELPAVSDEAWGHLESFLHALGGSS